MINDLKEFEKLLKICRKQGVLEVAIPGFAVKFGELPKRLETDEAEGFDIATDDLTEDEIMARMR